jgi:hypothetical protein
VVHRQLESAIGPRNSPSDASGGIARAQRLLEHDPEKWIPVFPRDKREAFARRSCSNEKTERDDDSKKNHHARHIRF